MTDHRLCLDEYEEDCFCEPSGQLHVYIYISTCIYLHNKYMLRGFCQAHIQGVKLVKLLLVAFVLYSETLNEDVSAWE